ncbi:FxLYD domain-containing protein [Halopelagius fulvigenes]|uniref:FxLYD domain-containing protein n=1 Tax=Halopelagius fulvigenes TaxID=1198324 RepID=A0ABD5U2M6_9EURY
MNARSDRITRRRLVVACGGGAAAALSGCVGASEEPTYREGQVNQTNGSQRTAEQMVAAEALATTEANQAANPLRSLSLETHEYAVQDGYKGPTVRGVVSNTGGSSIAYAEVRVRVYDADGAHLGQFLSTTRDLAPESRWRFEVILLSSASDIAAYDIATVGISA